MGGACCACAVLRSHHVARVRLSPFGGWLVLILSGGTGGVCVQREYLKEPFFALLGEHLPERVLLVTAEDSATGELVAGALHLLGDDCVYGRYWGCGRRVDCLRFELCYYQVGEARREHGGAHPARSTRNASICNTHASVLSLTAGD